MCLLSPIAGYVYIYIQFIYIYIHTIYIYIYIMEIWVNQLEREFGNSRNLLPEMSLVTMFSTIQKFHLLQDYYITQSSPARKKHVLATGV